MSRHFLLLLALKLVVVVAIGQPLSVKEREGLFSVWFNGEERLTHGEGLVKDSKKQYRVHKRLYNDAIVLSLPGISKEVKPQEYAGIFFENIPNLAQSITLWRYKPWNSWTKPITITDATKMQEWDVQFFYWQYNDGLYGAAVPLSGDGYRTTLGGDGAKWGSKAVSYAANKMAKQVPAMVIAFDKDPYKLFHHIYKTAMQAMGTEVNLREKKSLPKPLQYIGWCTWNASDNGNKLNEKQIVEAVQTFRSNNFPLGWVLIDDGWFQHKGGQLQSLVPDPVKFPNGFKPLVSQLKTKYQIKYAGIWHAFNGYWNGIDPESRLGKRYKSGLFSWTQKERPDLETAPLKTYSFIKPTSDSLYAFYDTWHRYFKNEGFDFIKVDNQLVTERMAVGTYPVFDLSSAMHKALYRSANKYFGGAVINCMDMTADAYMNFGSSAVGRAVEDYFPYKPTETYDLQHGNAAAHLVQATYNSIYFSQLVFPDFDMFQSHHPHAVFHALARTLNNGPIYLTDVPGSQNFELLKKLVYSDGRTIRSGTALLPTEDCLFQVQDKKIFKAFSTVGGKGLLGLFNAADADTVNGVFKVSDISGIKGKNFAVYDYFAGKLQVASVADAFAVQLLRMGYGLYYIVPVTRGFAAFGLIDKYNAPATIINEKWTGNSVTVYLYEGGSFRAYCSKKPATVLLNGKPVTFSFKGNVLDVLVPLVKHPSLTIKW